MKVSLNFLYQMVKKSITCGYEKKDLLRLLMLVVDVEAIFCAKEILSRCVLRIRRTPLHRV